MDKSYSRFPETTGIPEILCRGYCKYSILAACFLCEASGFGGVNVDNPVIDTQKTGGAIPPTEASAGIPKPTNRERRVSRAAVLEPLLFSVLFCMVEILGPLIKDPSSITASQISFWRCVELFIGYFAATLISMVVFMLLQQYYYNCFAGIDDDKCVYPLGVVFLLYIIIFVIYLLHKNFLTKWITLVWTVLSIITVWTSLRTDVRKIDSSFTQDNRDSNVFSGHH